MLWANLSLSFARNFLHGEFLPRHQKVSCNRPPAPAGFTSSRGSQKQDAGDTDL